MLPFVTIGAIGALAATPAQAYVQYQVVTNGLATGIYFHWKQTCIPLVAYPNDISNEMSAEQVEQAASAAAAAWSQVQNPCTYLDIRVSASFDPTRVADPDFFNVLVFKNPWCEPGDATCQAEALALTTVSAGRVTGTIQSADIEVNTENDVWTDLVTNPAAGKQDLQNALTHEMGHLIGLDHNCYTPGGDKIHMVDNTGMLVPACIGAPEVVQQGTMYNVATQGDVEKRTLAADELQAICDIYPLAQDPGYCPDIGQVPPTTSNSGCNCSTGPGLSSHGAGALPALGLLLALATRRRRRAP